VASSGYRLQPRDRPYRPCLEHVPLQPFGSKIVIADDKARLGIKKGHLAESPEQFVERGMLRVHLGPFNGVNHHLGCPIVGQY
jgi:hypothetical protein